MFHSNLPLPELIEQLTMYGRDPAMVGVMKSFPAFVDLCRDVASAPTVTLKACPSLDVVSAMQATIFDNHTKMTPKERAKTTKARYGCNIRAWVDKVDFDKPAWEVNGVFWPADQAVAKATSLQINKRNPISDATLACVTTAATCGAYEYVGLLRHTAPGEGTVYHDSHILCLNVESGIVTGLRLYSPNASLEFPAFSQLGADKRPLSGNAVFQSRYSTQEQMVAWSTGEGEELR